MKKLYVLAALPLMLSGCLTTGIGDCASSNNLAQARCNESLAYDDYYDCLQVHDKYICEATRQNAQKAGEYRQMVKDGLIQ